MRFWKSVVLVALVVLSLPSLAMAQTHPCDITPTQNATFTGQVKAQWCWDGKNTDGLPDTATTYKVYFDSDVTPTVTGVPTLVTTTANAAGQKLYESSYFAAKAGPHSIRVSVSDASAESLASLPFAFSQVVAPPSQPFGLRTAK